MVSGDRLLTVSLTAVGATNQLKNIDDTFLGQKTKKSDMKIKVKKLLPEARLPEYAYPGDSGADLFSAERCVVEGMSWRMVRSGIAVEIPDGYELQIRPKSGMAKNGVTVLNTPGTIDSGYRGEIKVILANLSRTGYGIEVGDKIAQVVVAPVVRAVFEEKTSGELSETERGDGGFGSTGLK